MDDPDETTAPPPRPPVALAGAAADAKLRFAAALSREEVLRRRRRRLVQLYSLYRSQLWALADELQDKHAKYWWHHGDSPAAVDPPPPPLPFLENGGGAASIDNVATGGMASFTPSNFVPPPLPHNSAGGAAAVTPKAVAGKAACSTANCGAKAIPLASYCFDHILSDPKQQLYKPCTFITKQSSMPNGKGTCGRPVLRCTTSSRCSDHDPKSQKNIIEALRNAGVGLPLINKSVPKFSLLISEAVHQIQMKRKQSSNGARTAPLQKTLK
ncbi:hypothetical protein ACQ4PT_034160 [Festuca glaucescens]